MEKNIIIDNLIFDDPALKILCGEIREVETSEVKIFTFETNTEINPQPIDNSPFDNTHMGINLVEKTFTLNSETVQAIDEFSYDVIGLNKRQVLEDNVIEEFKRNNYKGALALMYNLGEKNFESQNIPNYTSILTLPKFKEKPVTWFINLFKSNYSLYKELDEQLISNKLIGKITKLSYLIASGGRCNKATHMLISSKMLTILEASPIFVYPKQDDVQHTFHKSPIYKVGTIHDIEVYVNLYNNWDDTKILLWNNKSDDSIKLFHIPGIKKECFVNSSNYNKNTTNYIKQQLVLEPSINTYKQYMCIELDIPEKTKSTNKIKNKFNNIFNFKK